MSESIEVCEHCGAKLRAYWVGITPGLVSALVKFRAATQVKGRNKIHLLEDMSGYWLLTRRGNEFLNGELAIPRRVKIFRNRIQEHSEDMVYVKDVLGKTPYFEKIEDIQYEPIAFKADETGQTTIL